MQNVHKMQLSLEVKNNVAMSQKPGTVGIITNKRKVVMVSSNLVILLNA